MPRTAARGGPQTRARISDVATQLFLERGFDAVTVAEVAREAGVSSVTVFKHFPRKEDLLLDRAEDAIELLRTAVRGSTDVLASLREATLRLADDRHALSGLKDGSIPFFVTVAASPALIARAREIADEIQQTLADELSSDPTTGGSASGGSASGDRASGGSAFGGDGVLLAAFLIAGYTTVLTGTARRLMAGDTPDDVAEDHRARVEHLFDKLHNGFAT